MSAIPQRAIALAFVALLLPLAAAQTSTPPVDPPGNTQTPEAVECTQPVDSCFPDLIPSNPTATATDERYPVTVCTGFLNVGDAPTATTWRLRVDIDGIPSGETQFSKAYQRGEGEGNVCFYDLQLVAGRHTMTVTVDMNNNVAESNENNNVKTIVFMVRATPQVDLRLTEFKVYPYEGAPKVNQIFVVNVTNIGTEVSAATTVQISDDNGVMATFGISSLRPRESRSVAHATRPEYRPVGTFIARATVDPDNTNAEIDELNNDAFLEYVVLDHPAPDMVITDVDLVGNFTEFRGVKAFVTVKNIGDQFVRGNLVRAVNETGDAVQEGYTLGILYPNQSSTVQLNLILRAGEREIRFIADPYELAQEKNESNNVWVERMTILKPVIVVDLPNLVIERIYAMPSDPRPGEAVSLGALIHNVGTNWSAETIVNFTVNGTTIGTAKVPVLRPDASYSAYIPWIVRTAGTYDLSALADGRHEVIELDEDDNALGRQFLVTAQAVPDPVEQPPTPPANTTKPTPPVNATPKPATPATPKPTPTPTTTNTGAARIAFSDLVIDTRSVPGGVKGVISASLRNPNIQPLGRLEVTFKVDEKQLTAVLVNGIRGAATESATTGEVDLPEGKHTVTVDVRIVGTNERPITREKTYEATAGAKSGIPSPAFFAVIATLAAAALLSRRQRK